MKNLATAIADGIVVLDLSATSLTDVLRLVVQRTVDKGIVPAEMQEEMLQMLQAREEQVSTALGHGVAIPHAYREGIQRPIVAFVRLDRPLDIGAADIEPTRYLFVLLGPTGQVDTHLDTLAAIARGMSDNEVRYDLGRAKSEADVIGAFEAHYQRYAPPAVEEKKERADGLSYMGGWGGGLMADIRRRLPVYKSDFTEGLHPKSLTATLFLFFACLAPAVTFGGLMYAATGGWMGVTEMLVATAICGTLYALLAGQPLIILGGTGPLLIFTGILYQLCRQFEIPFLPCYAVVGLWTALFLLILAVTDASCFIRSFTRFTDEIFAGLISLIFIAEALKRIFGYINEARAAEIAHDVAFLSLMMALGTFIVAMMLSNFRKSRYLVPAAREFLADFGPTLAVLLMLAFGLLFPNVKPAPLEVPETFGPTTGRSWLVAPTGLPLWVWGAASVPALLATVLIYLDQNITARLVNSRDHVLRKGEGYHLDLAIVALLIGMCSMLGMPWLVAATVRSLNHVRALATVEDRITRAGERRDEIVHVRESRVTGLAVHLLIGGCLFFLPIFQLVPKAVLYGLFLYMGIVSIFGNQLFERVALWLMDSNLYPRTHYIRNVPMRVIHKFTLLQVICLAVLWVVKTSAVGILFPLFIALLVLVRRVAGHYFDAQHLAALDAEEAPEEEGVDYAGP